MKASSNPRTLLCPAAKICVVLLFRATLLTSTAGTVTLAWDANTETNLAGYSLYYGTSPGAYAGRITLGAVTTHTVSNLAPGIVCYFAVTAINTAGLESEPSNELSVTIPHQQRTAIQVMPLACSMSFIGETEGYVLCGDNATACVSLTALPGAGENGLRTGVWFDNGELLTEGLTITNCLSLGQHTITVAVEGTNGAAYSTSVELTVISPAEAIELCVGLIEATSLDRKDKRPLVASLLLASGYFQSGEFELGVGQLCAFQTKCRTQIGMRDPVMVERLISSAQQIVDALICLAESGKPGGIAAIAPRFRQWNKTLAVGRAAIREDAGSPDECVCSRAERCSSPGSTC